MSCPPSSELSHENAERLGPDEVDRADIIETMLIGELSLLDAMTNSSWKVVPTTPYPTDLELITHGLCYDRAPARQPPCREAEAACLQCYQQHPKVLLCLAMLVINYLL